MNVVLALALVVCCGFSISQAKYDDKHGRQLTLGASPVNLKKPDLDLCNVCYQLTGQTINQLLNIILNGAVVGGCNELCGLLNASEAIDVACNLVCDLVGIKEFIAAIEKADLDPVYMCEILKACKVFDEGDANITAFTITPKQGPAGTEFQLEVDFKTKNGTGTGEAVIEVHTVDHFPVDGGQLMESLDPGSYSIKFTLQTQKNCQQEPCEMWEKGIYNVTMRLCNGECGSKHPHSQLYDTATGSFQITAED